MNWPEFSRAVRAACGFLTERGFTVAEHPEPDSEACVLFSGPTLGVSFSLGEDGEPCVSVWHPNESASKVRRRRLLRSMTQVGAEARDLDAALAGIAKVLDEWLGKDETDDPWTGSTR